MAIFAMGTCHKAEAQGIHKLTYPSNNMLIFNFLKLLAYLFLSSTASELHADRGSTSHFSPTFYIGNMSRKLKKGKKILNPKITGFQVMSPVQARLWQSYRAAATKSWGRFRRRENIRNQLGKCQTAFLHSLSLRSLHSYLWKQHP